MRDAVRMTFSFVGEEPRHTKIWSLAKVRVCGVAIKFTRSAHRLNAMERKAIKLSFAKNVPRHVLLDFLDKFFLLQDE